MTASTAPSTPSTTSPVAAEGLADRDGVSLAEIARRETAAVYGQTQHEHHSHRWTPPAEVTGWERRRLARAARQLTRGDA